MNLDEAIIKCYADFNTPSDQIAMNSELAARFLQIVKLQLDDGKTVDEASCVSRLIYLRKRGFLKRLRRKKPR